MENNCINSKSIGDIYRMIYQNKQSSRQDISSALNISLPTTSKNLDQLRNLGFIYNAGEFSSTGGRKATMLRCVPDARFALGIDITQNHLSFALIDLDLNIIAKKRMRIAFEETSTYFRTLQFEINNILDSNISDRSKLLGIGISMPVIIGEDQKSIIYAEVIHASHDIYEKMAQYINVPFLLFNDSNSAGLAESWGEHNAQPMIYLSLSSSVGGANMTNHNIYTGVNMRSSEFGHMTIVPNGRKCYCGRYGCVDAYCSAKNLSDFTGGDLNKFFTDLKTGENPGLTRLFDQYLDYLAIVVNNLRVCYDCNIVLGGYVGAYMTDFIDEFRKKAIKRNPFEQDASYIQVCKYRTEASAVGAGIYYIDNFINNFTNNF